MYSAHRLVANADDRRAWVALIDEALACAVDISRATQSLERLAKVARSRPSPFLEAAQTDPFRSLVRRSLAFCIELQTGRKFSCSDLATAARVCRDTLPVQSLPFRQDIDG